MPEVTVHSADGAEQGTLELADAIFGVKVRPDLVHTAIVAQLAAKRAGTARAKTRGEVRGGGRKPYRQKGTGRARSGSATSPLWHGGGVIFPPRPRDYAKRVPRKVRRRALFSAWSDHVAGGTLLVLDSFGLEAPRTKLAAAVLRRLLQPVAELAAAAAPAPTTRDEDDARPGRRVRVRRRALLLLLPAEEDDVRLATRNLSELSFDLGEKVTVIFTLDVGTAPYASVYDLVLADAVIATSQGIERVAAEFATAAPADEEALA